MNCIASLRKLGAVERFPVCSRRRLAHKILWAVNYEL